MVKEYVSGSAMTFERNPNYWDTTTINGKEYEIPFIDELVFPIIPDESTRVAALRTGEIDIHWAVLSRYKDSLARTSPELKVYSRLLRPPVIALNMRRPFLSEREVRRALSIAIDREAINEAVLGPGGVMYVHPVAPSLVPDVATPFEELPASTQELYVYDPVKARQILVDAGYPEGFSLKMLLSSTNLTGIDIASMAKENWEAIGVTLTIETMEPTAFTRLLWGAGTAGSKEGLDADYDCTIQSDWGPDAPFDAMYSGFCPSGRNFAQFYDKDFIARYAEAKQKVDEVEQFPILRDLNLIALDSAAYIGVGAPVALRYWWPWVKNYYGEFDAGCFDTGPIFARIWIDQDLKAEMGY